MNTMINETFIANQDTLLEWTNQLHYFEEVDRRVKSNNEYLF